MTITHIYLLISNYSANPLSMDLCLPVIEHLATVLVILILWSRNCVVFNIPLDDPL